MKRPKWLGESRATKADKQKKARQQTDQRMKQQDAVKKNRTTQRRKNTSRSGAPMRTKHDGLYPTQSGVRRFLV